MTAAGQSFLSVIHGLQHGMLLLILLVTLVILSLESQGPC